MPGGGEVSWAHFIALIPPKNPLRRVIPYGIKPDFFTYQDFT